MNISFALNNLSLYSPSSFGGGYSASSSSGRAPLSGQTGISGTQMPEQTGLSGQAGISGQVGIPGQTAPQGAKGKRPVPGQQDLDSYECQTCKNRKYQDGSNDPGVSFKTPTRVSPERAAFAIRSHEMEHVAHAKAKALKEDQEIVSQSVSYHTGICPECGRTYMAGGTTRTTFRSKPVTEEKPVEVGANVDAVA